jgi:nicotinate-nucleotide pyrophosphorylase (carboxylating)
MAKDNHLGVLTSQGLSVTEALVQAKSRLPHTTHIEVEVDRLDQIEPVLAEGADLILLDNFTVEETAEAVALVAGRSRLESSGGLDLAVARRYAETGVDYLAVGALTHSAPVLDIGLDLREDA